MLTLEGYSIDKVFQRMGQFSIYKGSRNIDKKKVMLKVCNSKEPNLSDLIALQHEYEILKQINLSRITHVYDLIKLQNRLVLVIEDAGEISLQEYLRNDPVNLSDFFKIAIQLVDAIGELHLMNIVHKDINPKSILINIQNLNVKLANFIIASELTHESQDSHSLNNLHSSLEYISPEQTGRMNRSIDFRSDFYSLGITFYEMLTGKVPFSSDDPIELIHLHLTSKPESMASINPYIPSVVAEIIYKLLSKIPEARYKSASGLKADLLLCQQQWINNKILKDFQIGQNDLQDHLVISQKLYGREKQLDALHTKFSNVISGHSELVFISGYSGIGKTSLVKELYHPIAKQHGYFLTGKFDQLQRSTPYSAIIEAFSGFVQHCLTEPESQLSLLRSLLASALRNNGQVLVNIIPNIELIIGKQPPLADLPPSQSKNRLESTFLNFVRAITQFKHPLILFIDDLQWIDIASLNLLQLLIEDHELHNLLIIGAYRDNEVFPNHPLMLMKQQLDKDNIKYSNIILTPLKEKDIENLISDSLIKTQEPASRLANLVLFMTHGNPFFINEFLKELHNENLLKFSYQDRCWSWDIDQIKKSSITDNVVDLLVSRIDKLPVKTRELLKLAACIGHTFDLMTLSTISERNLKDTAKHILEATKSSFIVPVNSTYQLLEYILSDDIDITHLNTEIKYRFNHDKIQQAAYQMIPDEIKGKVHLQIGRLLMKDKILNENDDQLFDILNHFNCSINEISDAREINLLTKYNLMAGRKAKSASAFQAAKSYISFGLQLLERSNQGKDKKLEFDLKKEYAICLYLTGEYESAENYFNQLLTGNNSVSSIEVCRLYCEMLATLNRHKEALLLAFNVLKSANIKIPEHPNKLHIILEIFKIKLLTGRKNIAEIDIPLMESEKYQQISALIAQLFTSSYLTDINLNFLLICINTQLSLRYGYTQSTGSSLISYAYVIMHGFNWYQQGLQFCALYDKLSKKYPQGSYEWKNQFFLEMFIDPWRFPLSKKSDVTHKLSRNLFDVGDFVYCNYCNIITFRQSLLVGKPISELNVYLKNMLNFIKKYKIKNLNVLSEFYEYTFQCLSSNVFSSEKIKSYEQSILGCNNKGEAAYFYVIAIKLCFLFGDYNDANYYVSQLNIYKRNISGASASAEGDFYSAISIFANMSRNNRHNMSTLNEIRDHLNRWAGWCPDNYQHYLYLFDAELARVNNDISLAIHKYSAAIKSAMSQNTYNIVALGYELLGRFYTDLDSPEVAQFYYQSAHDTYILLGYSGKATSLCEKHLITSHSPDESAYKNAVSDTDLTSIDLLSLMKSSQAISSEIELDKLLQKLLVILLQNAGAHRVLLLVKEKDSWYVEAEGEPAKQRISLTHRESFDKRKDLPLTLIRYVIRTHESTLVQSPEDVEQHSEHDEYIKINQPQSMLVIPVAYHGELQSILYLENRTASMAFKMEHVRILQLLSSQTAISLQNAKLYYQATHDGLTGLANRNLLSQVFDSIVIKSKITHTSIAVMLFDLDYFKTINDKLGHHIGDQVLIHISQLLSLCIGNENLAARLGGDEFVAIVKYRDVVEVMRIAEHFLRKLKEPVKIEGHELILSSSIGISLFPHDGETISDLLKKSDIALYRVKAKGKNQFQLYTASQHI